MRSFRSLYFVACFVAPFAVAAEESCAIRSIKLMADGKIEELSASFKSSTSTASQLKEVSLVAGALSGIRLANSPKFKEHKRISVGKADSPYFGAWVDANSKNLGEIQFHIAMPSANKCELLALHMDFAK